MSAGVPSGTFIPCAASPFNQASGVGMNGQVTEAELDQLESFYRGRGSALRIMLCPLADPSLVQLLGCRGYRLTEMENVLVRAIQGEGAVPQVFRLHEGGCL